MPQFVTRSLNYTEQLQEHYQQLSDLPGFVLLESSDKTHGRYDIVSAYPYDRIQLQHYDPQAINQLAEHLETNYPSVSDLPFQGGAIGYISYDFGAQAVGIYSTPHAHLKSLPALDLGFYDWAIIADHQLKKVTLFAAHQHESTDAVIDEVIFLWHQIGNGEHSEYVLESSFEPLMAKPEYLDAVHAIHHALQTGRSYQVNFTQPFQARFKGDCWEMYRKISAQNPVPFSAFMRMPQSTVLSFSPERFLSYDQGHVLTSPIKGTMRRSQDPQEDNHLATSLATCSKNKAENVMIVDLMRNDLSKIAQPGSVQVSRLCAVESYTSVHHLVSDVEGQCKKEYSALHAFMSCFPGGSITGAPKLEAMRIINEQEQYSRGIYCGSIGYFSRHGRFDTSIAIRTITAKDNILHLGTGGGIVIDSSAEEEYLECYTKIAAIMNGLK